jgi:hypothetical protein
MHAGTLIVIRKLTLVLPVTGNASHVTEVIFYTIQKLIAMYLPSILHSFVALTVYFMPRVTPI